MRRHSGPPIALALVAALAAAIVLALRRTFPVRVDGPSMLPTLRSGDFVAVSPGTARLRPGSIAVVRTADGVEIIKRVAALGGDRHDGDPVPPGHVFVVGDNPKASTDSRETGPVPVARVVGIARAVYWPLGRVRML